MSDLKYTGIAHVGSAGLGTFQLGADKIQWASGAAKVSLPSKDLRAAQCQRKCGREHWQLTLRKKSDKNGLAFANFRLKDLSAVRSHLASKFGVTLVDQAVATNGNSWGAWAVDEKAAEMRLTAPAGEITLEVPAALIKSVVPRNKAELSMELSVAEDPENRDEEYLDEIRLLFPATSQVTPAQAREELLRLMGSASGDDSSEPSLRINYVTVVNPRGKHSLEFGSKALKIHGASQMYTVLYSNIKSANLFTLLTDEVVFLLILKEPFKGGSKRDHVMFMMPEDRKEVPEMAPSLFKPFRMIEGSEVPVHMLMPNFLKNIAGINILAPSSDARENLTGKRDGKYSGVSCQYKFERGELVFFKSQMIFAPKPTAILRFEEMGHVELSGFKGARHAVFNLVAHMNDGSTHEFSQLDSGSRRGLEAFMRARALSVVSDMTPDRRSDGTPTRGGLPPARAAKTRARAAVKKAAKADDSDDEDDEDFEDGSGSPSEAEDESVDAEEYTAPAAATKRQRRR